MYRDHTVGVVVPAYNEAEHLGGVLEDLPQFVDHVYVVDDASTDDTWAVVREYVGVDPDVNRGDRDEEAPAEPETGPGSGPGTESDADAVDADSDDSETDQPAVVEMPDGGELTYRLVPVRHEENQGAGGALKTGYRHARDDGVELVVAMDADGQMDPSMMRDLLDPLVEGDADYAKGDRLASAEYSERMPPFRLFGNWLLTALTRVASGYWRLDDPQNGYTAITNEALSAVDLAAVPDGHDYCNDLLVRLNVAGMRVADVPMPAVYGDEESTISYSRFIPITATTLLRRFLWRQRQAHVREFHPLVLCYGAGAAGGVAALRRTGVALLGDADDGTGDRGLADAGRALLWSALFVLAAMALDARENADKEATDG